MLPLLRCRVDHTSGPESTFFTLFEDRVRSEGVQLTAGRRINRQEVCTYRQKRGKFGLFLLRGGD